MHLPDAFFDQDTAARLTAACLAILAELEPCGVLPQSVGGEARRKGEPAPQEEGPWLALRIRAHRACHDAPMMRGTGLAYLRAELRAIKYEAYAMFVAEEAAREGKREAGV